MSKGKKLIFFSGVLGLVGIVLLVLLAGRKKIDYYKFIDEECGFEISKYLEFENADYENADSYDLQFKVKAGYERELEGLMGSRYRDNLLEGKLHVRNASMVKLIEAGTTKHIYTFMREGKVKNPLTGERILSIPVQIIIVDIDDRQYAIFSAIW